MKRKFLSLAQLILAAGIVFISCAPEEEDKCSSELGDVGPDYSCTVSVFPQLCTVDGVDDHWVLDGVEYACPNGDCNDIPQALVEAILAKEGCGTKKSADLAAVNAEISQRASVILANLKMEATLCRD